MRTISPEIGFSKYVEILDLLLKEPITYKEIMEKLSVPASIVNYAFVNFKQMQHIEFIEDYDNLHRKTYHLLQC